MQVWCNQDPVEDQDDVNNFNSEAIAVKYLTDFFKSGLLRFNISDCRIPYFYSF